MTNKTINTDSGEQEGNGTTVPSGKRITTLFDDVRPGLTRSQWKRVKKILRNGGMKKGEWHEYGIEEEEITCVVLPQSAPTPMSLRIPSCRYCGQKTAAYLLSNGVCNNHGG